MTTQWPLLKARVVALLPTLNGWAAIERVFPGPPDTQFAGKAYATVGWTSVGETGSYMQEQNTSGAETNETGSLSGEIVASIGDEDPLATENTVFAALNGLQAAISADRRLGVLPPCSSLSMTVTAAPVANSNGTGFIARFVLSYYAVS